MPVPARLLKSFCAFTALIALLFSFALVGCSSPPDANLRNPPDGGGPPVIPSPGSAAKVKAHSETLSAIALTQLNWAKQALWLSLGVDPYRFASSQCLQMVESKAGLTITRTYTSRNRACRSGNTRVRGSFKIVTTYRESRVNGQTILWPVEIQLTKASPFLTAETQNGHVSDNFLDIDELSVTVTETPDTGYTANLAMQLSSLRDSSKKDIRGRITVQASGQLLADDFLTDNFVLSSPRFSATAYLQENDREKVFSSSLSIGESATRASFPLQKGLPQGSLTAVQTYLEGNKSKDFDGAIQIEGNRIRSAINNRTRTLPNFALTPNFAEQVRTVEILIRDIEKTNFGAPRASEDADADAETDAEIETIPESDNRRSGGAASPNLSVPRR